MTLGLNNLMLGSGNFPGNILGAGQGNIQASMMGAPQSDASVLPFSVFLTASPDEILASQKVALVSPSLLGQEDLTTSEEVSTIDFTFDGEVKVPAQKNLDISKEAALLSNSAGTENSTPALEEITDLLQTEVFVALDDAGEFIVVDGEGQKINIPALDSVLKNPALQELLAQKLETGAPLKIEAQIIKPESGFSSLSEVILLAQEMAQESAQETVQIEASQNVASTNNNQIIANKAQDAVLSETPEQLIPAPANQSVQTKVSASSQTVINSAGNQDAEMNMNFGNGENQQQGFANNQNKFTLAPLDAEGLSANSANTTQSAAQNFSAHLAHNRPVVQQPVIDQVAMQLQKGVSGQIDKITLQLSPAELGKVTINLDFSHDSQTKTIVMAEKAETLEMLKQDAKSLQKILEDAGFDAGKNSLEFSLGQNQAEQQKQNKQKTSDASFSLNDASIDGVSEMANTTAHKNIISATKIDIMI